MPVIHQIQTRRDTSAGWSSTNPVLALGEAGFDSVLSAIKVGNGATAWNGLPYTTYPNLTPTTAGQSLVAGGQYAIGLHTVVLPDLGQEKSFLAVPSNGEWIAAGRGFDVPAGWNIVTMNADPQAGRVAVFVCDTANSLWRVYC